MYCRIEDLKNKQVVCVKDGKVLGYVSDVELDTENGSLSAVVIFGRPRVFGVFGKSDDIVIPWRDIEVIGQETVLVSTDPTPYLRNIV
ncbi:MAG: YlmC/YmxH family sporulation protein [Clostridia bacterium]|nr:YlmC/YmxH family sporulation protein [Clostridia bacterium]